MKEQYSGNQRRWYDFDPVLSQSMSILEHSSDQNQIRMALNLIKIIIEHNIESADFTDVEDILSAVESGKSDGKNSRWYDLDATLKTAINMLERCSKESQKQIAVEMAKIVVDKIKEDKDEEDDE